MRRFTNKTSRSQWLVESGVKCSRVHRSGTILIHAGLGRSPSHPRPPRSSDAHPQAWAEVTKAREMRRIQTCLEKERERLVALESQFETNWEAVTSVLATGDRVAFHETCANHAEQELEWLNAQQRFLNERRKQVRGSQHQHVNHEMNRNLSSSYGR